MYIRTFRFPQELSMKLSLSTLASSAAMGLGLVAVGVGGYNLLTTGCPLGSCSNTSTEVVTTSTSDAHECALGCGHDSHNAVAVSTTKKSCEATCSSEAKSSCSEAEALTTTVSSESHKACCHGEGPKEACCGGKQCEEGKSKEGKEGKDVAQSESVPAKDPA
jgi:hypothetical protein